MPDLVKSKVTTTKHVQILSPLNESKKEAKPIEVSGLEMSYR